MAKLRHEESLMLKTLDKHVDLVQRAYKNARLIQLGNRVMVIADANNSQGMKPVSEVLGNKFEAWADAYLRCQRLVFQIEYLSCNFSLDKLCEWE